MKRSIYILAAAFLALVAITSCGRAKEPKILIAYFSHTGNTRLVAEHIQSIVGGDIYEIKTADPYPEDDREAHEVGREELNRGYERPLAGKLPDVSRYDIIFIGTPNWFSTYAAPVGTFVKSLDLAGKKVAPFITYKGGPARYYDDLAKICPESTMLEGFGLRGSEAAASREKVREWIDKILRHYDRLLI